MTYMQIDKDIIYTDIYVRTYTYPPTKKQT